MSDITFEELKKKYDIEEVSEGVDLSGWKVLFIIKSDKSPSEATAADLLVPTLETSPVLKFGLKAWIGEFRLTWCYRNLLDIVVLVDENCPEYYFLDSSEIESVVKEVRDSRDTFKKYSYDLDSYYTYANDGGLYKTLTEPTGGYTTYTSSSLSSDWIGSLFDSSDGKN